MYNPHSHVTTQQTQPRTYRLTLKALLMLPFRICNPPPAVGKIRSCGVVPLFDVSLDDILDRKHLPPLGLKDFEEWLIYVETAPENLYFILWLREYTARYSEWAAYARSNHNTYETRMDWQIHTSSQLAMFYMRAKQTFFTPNSNYELNLPSCILAPFHSPNNSPHPDPIVFNEVAHECRVMLKDSLRRFVTAQFNNVGNNRVLCGIIAGTVCCILGALLPLIFNFALGRSRWERLSALPGMWLGVALLASSVNGVCLGVYIFGDLRQLRKFELTRPAISKPTPLYSARHRQLLQSPIISNPLTSSSVPRFSQASEISAPPPLTISTAIVSSAISSPPPAYSPLRFPQSNHRSRLDSQTSSTSMRSDADISFESGSFGGTNSIHISPPFYDPNPVEGPATSPVDLYVPNAFCKEASQSRFDHEDEDETEKFRFPVTAAFIHPFDAHRAELVGALDGSPTDTQISEDLQRVSPFNFDDLPDIPATRHHNNKETALPPRAPSPVYSGPRMVLIEPEAQSLQEEGDFTPKGFLRRMQSRCNINKWFVLTSGDSQVDVSESKRKAKSSRELSRTEGRMQKHIRIIKAVPAFGSPLTKILSPVVVRGQWEIVMRSMIIACFVSWVVLGCLLAVPPH